MILNKSNISLTPLVTIVIPSFNRKDLITRTIDSILSQKCDFGYELIIGDDCSTDGVREVLLKYQKNHPEKIRLIFHTENVGLGANWAYCVKEARGKYLANCDNDDYWHNPSKLQLQVDFMESNPEIGVCHTYYRNAINQKIFEKTTDNSSISEPLYKAIANIRNFECCNSSILYRKELLDSYIRLDDYIDFRFVLQDWNTWVALAYNNVKFYCLSVSTTTISLDNDSITRDTDFTKLENRLRKQESTTKYISENYPGSIDYSPDQYNTYIKKVLLNLSFLKWNFKVAKRISTELKSESLNDKKILYSQNPFFFYIYCALKSFRRAFRTG